MSCVRMCIDIVYACACVVIDSACICKDSVSIPFHLFYLYIIIFVLRSSHSLSTLYLCVTTGSAYHFTMFIAITIEQVSYSVLLLKLLN